MSASAAAELPGLPRLAPLALLQAVEHGLPLATLDRLAAAIAPGDAGFAHRMVARATLARRRKSADAARLTAEESGRVARLAEVWALAVEVWGSADAARASFRPHAMLDHRRPVDVVLASEFGRPLVEGILGRLQYGAAA